MTESHFHRRLTQLHEEQHQRIFTDQLAPRWEREIPWEVQNGLLTDDEAARLLAEVRGQMKDITHVA